MAGVHGHLLRFRARDRGGHCSEIVVGGKQEGNMEWATKLALFISVGFHCSLTGQSAGQSKVKAEAMLHAEPLS